MGWCRSLRLWFHHRSRSRERQQSSGRVFPPRRKRPDKPNLHSRLQKCVRGSKSRRGDQRRLGRAQFLPCAHPAGGERAGRRLCQHARETRAGQGCERPSTSSRAASRHSHPGRSGQRLPNNKNGGIRLGSRESSPESCVLWRHRTIRLRSS